MRLLFLVLICAIPCGCRDAAEPEKPATFKPQAAVKLTVLVVDDAELAQGVSLLAGEWSERSGGQLAVAETTLRGLLAGEQPAADVLIYPSREVGGLVMRDWLRPVRPSVLQDPALAWGDILRAIRDQVVRYGGQVYGLPLGDMPLAISWQGELPETLPTTWEQFVQQGNGLESPGETAFPLTGEFLARAVALTSPADRATLFFDPQTMDARLTTTQLVKALEWLEDATQHQGKAVASVTLPRGNGKSTLTPLLVADEVYTASMDRWDQLENANPPVILGFAGRLVSVTKASRNAASAFKLIPWLTSGAVGTDLSRRSQATLWYRASQVSKAASWFDGKTDDDRIRWLTQQLSQGEAYMLPRIPAIDRYLAELEAVLREVAHGKQTAGRALAAAETKWDALTDSLGREEQRLAFNRHLGLVE